MKKEAFEGRMERLYLSRQARNLKLACLLMATALLSSSTQSRHSLPSFFISLLHALSMLSHFFCSAVSWCAVVHFDTNCRMVTTCSSMPLNNIRKCSLCSICFQQPNCKSKLYTIPIDFTRHARFKTHAEAVSKVADVAGVDSTVNPSSAFLDNIQWSDTLLDRSNESLNDTNDFQNQLQELFDEVKTLISKGMKKDAIDLLRANYKAVKEQLDEGYRGVEEAAFLDVVALGYMAVGHFKIVDSLLNLLKKLVDGLEDSQLMLDSILVHMGSMYSALGKFEMSSIMYQRAISILEHSYGKSSTSLVTPLMGLAKVLSLTKRVPEALEKYLHVVRIFEAAHGVKSADVVLPLSCIGNLLISEGNVDEAEKYFTRVYTICTKLYGENDGRLGMALCSLAHVKCAQEKPDEAITLYREALHVVKDAESLEEDDIILEKMRIDLAELLHAVGRASEGRALLEECLQITEKHKGKEHPSMVNHLVNLATSYSYSKKYGEAERALRRSLQIMTKTTGSDDPSITFPMLHLAVTLYKLKQDKEAEEIALEALRIREASYGKDSLPVGEALDCLVSIQARLGEDDNRLLELLNRVLAIQEKEFGNESEEVMITLKKIVYYLNKLGRKDEKFPLNRRLSLLRKKLKQRLAIHWRRFW
ncbi:hypothetical protein V2J09_010864 [Rumex salicifolius]